MRYQPVIFAAVAVLAGIMPARAELENVQVGGSLRIRIHYYTNMVPNSDNAAAGAITAGQIIWPASLLPRRPIGSGASNGPGIIARFSWNSHDSHTLTYTEQRTRLNVKADFTNNVSAFIEFDSYSLWGETFRSDYITGADNRGTADVAIYQAYIEANEMFGMPLRLRIGRQEMSFGSQWLVGVNDIRSNFRGLSFDAARLTYATDLVSVDAWASTLAEGGVRESDDDVMFYGIYGSYKGIPKITLDAYWMYVRDARRLNDTRSNALLEWWEDVFHIDNYDPTNLHTVGVRGAGTVGALDFEAEAAYQFGNADQVGFLFKPFQYGDDNARFDNFAANLEVGYTFDVPFRPRVFVGGAYLGGEDNRGLSFWQWVNPYYAFHPQASVSFNRLFSNWKYSAIIDPTNMSNAWIARTGVIFYPVKSVEVDLFGMYFQTLHAFEQPYYITVGDFKIPVAPALSFWTKPSSKDLASEVNFVVIYNYTEDLQFRVAWEHVFAADGLADGNFSMGNGLQFNGGTGKDGVTHMYFETRLCF